MECRESGSVPLYPNFNSYMKCVSTSSHFLRTSHSCDNPLHYWNPSTNSCEDPCTWNLAYPFVCTKEGRFPDPYSCTKHHECKKYDNVLKDKEHYCPSGTLWVPTASGGSCSRNGKCELPLQTRCDLPICKKINSIYVSYLIKLYM